MFLLWKPFEARVAHNGIKGSSSKVASSNEMSKSKHANNSKSRFKQDLGILILFPAHISLKESVIYCISQVVSIVYLRIYISMYVSMYLCL